ncbi:organomercurial lyase MerB [Amycolatopsis thermoflava]|uniref:organomercurial lyase MerB n=1 Tax=Amycolatopsis thermoflava TaxID=84480 RepID=UPI00364FE613
MNPVAEQIATRLSAAFNGGGAASAQPWLWRPLLTLLATGQPVTTDELAAATGRSAADIRQALAAMPDTEYDEHGRIVGAGLTQRPTPHHFEINGHQLYTWCALDTLIFPAVLGATARVESPCHATGTPVRLTVTPTGVHDLDPTSAVVSLVTPDDMNSVRAAFCNHVHFFANPDAADRWLAEHPGTSVLPVADAYQLGQPLTQHLLDGREPGQCC